MKTMIQNFKDDPSGLGVLVVLIFFLAIALGLTVYTFAGAIQFAAVDSGWFQSAEEAAATQPARNLVP